MLHSVVFKRWPAAIIVAVFACLASTALADTVTLTGEVNDNFQILVNGQIFEIADTPEGNTLAESHVSAKVKVVGTLEESDDLKILTVISYEVLAE